MLVLRRKEGEWLTITHSKTGDQLRIRAYAITCDPSRVSLGFDDPDRNFQIDRDERYPEGDDSAQGSHNNQPYDSDPA